MHNPTNTPKANGNSSKLKPPQKISCQRPCVCVLVCLRVYVSASVCRSTSLWSDPINLILTHCIFCSLRPVRDVYTEFPIFFLDRDRWLPYLEALFNVHAGLESNRWSFPTVVIHYNTIQSTCCCP